MTRNRLAIVTFERLPDLSPDDQLFLRELARLGLTVEPAVWSDGSVDWSRFSSIVIRSCWDYHHRHEAFLEWLTKIEELGLSIWNRPTLIRWNIDKIYLRELRGKGFPDTAHGLGREGRQHRRKRSAAKSGLAARRS